MASLVASLSIATQSSINSPANPNPKSYPNPSSFSPKPSLCINLNLKSYPNSTSNSSRCLAPIRPLFFASKGSSHKFRVFASSSPPSANDDDGIGPASSEIEEKIISTGTSGTENGGGGKEGYSDEDGGIIAELKQSLVDNLTGTDRGLKASSEVRAEIVELIAQLEAKNPTPAPTEALPLLNGKWILAYTSFSELFPLLAAGSLPLVKVGEISQFIDSDALTVENSVTFTGPLASTSFSTSASFEIRSPKRVQIKFEEGVIGTPQLTDSIEIPDNIQLLGQNIDLTPAQGLLKQLQEAASSVARTISGQPPLKFPIRTDKAQSWLLTTYLDKDLRISRGDGGSIFVLVKEDSPLLEDL